MKITIIIPTYNEKENALPITEALESEFKNIPEHEISILFVDANSADGTKEIILEMCKKYPNVFLLSEKEKSGLGSAYMSAMTYAFKNLSPDAIIEMDADFQHDPKDVKRLVSKFEEGYDYVLSSRYIKGGSIPKQWALYRKFLSFFGNLYLRVFLGLLEVSDVTSGFRISRVSKLSQVDFSKIERVSYLYKIQLLYEMKRLGSKIAEIPIKFGLRDRGDSKMEKENIIGSLILSFKLRLGDHHSFIKFLIVGTVGLTVQTTIYLTLILGLSFTTITALLPAFLAAVATTFTLNNLWSFRDRKLVKSSQKTAKFLAFVAVNVGSYFIQRSCIYLAHIVFDQSVLLTVLFGYTTGIGLGLVWNYLFYSRIIWKK